MVTKIATVDLETGVEWLNGKSARGPSGLMVRASD